MGLLQGLFGSPPPFQGNGHSQRQAASGVGGGSHVKMQRVWGNRSFLLPVLGHRLSHTRELQLVARSRKREAAEGEDVVALRYRTRPADFVSPSSPPKRCGRKVLPLYFTSSTPGYFVIGRGGRLFWARVFSALGIVRCDTAFDAAGALTPS